MVQRSALEELRARFLAFGLAPPALMALGLSTGCGDKELDDTGGDDSRDALCDAALERGYEGMPAEVYCDLLDFVADAGLSSEDQASLEDCIHKTYGDSERETLLSTFQDASEDELAAILEGLLETCADDGNDDSGGTH